MIKTKELIEKVKKLGFEIVCYTNPWSNVESNCKYNSIRIYLHDELLVEVWTNCQYAISTISDGHSCYLYGYDVDELYKVCFEYASTPVEDREEEKKYYLIHRYFRIAGGGSGFFTIENASGLSFLKYKTNLDHYSQKFTEKEIEELKEKLNTNLDGFEMVEVEDEENQRK